MINESLGSGPDTGLLLIPDAAGIRVSQGIDQLIAERSVALPG